MTTIVDMFKRTNAQFSFIVHLKACAHMYRYFFQYFLKSILSGAKCN